MSIPIKDLPNDLNVTLADKFVGTNSSDNNSYNYGLQEIVNIIAAKTGSAVTTDNVKTVTETAPGNWLTVLNTLNPSWSINPADVALVEVLDTLGSFSGLYIYLKASTETDRIGVGETDVSASDFMALRLTNDIGETNTLAGTGVGDATIATAKDGTTLKVKDLTQGANITLTEDGDQITIAMNETLGEVNTLSSVGTIGYDITSTKSGSDLRVKNIYLKGAYGQGNSTDVIYRVWEKQVKTASTSISSSTDKFTTIHMKNGVTPAVVTIPSTLAADFECAMIVYGTAEVSFVAGAGATILQSELKAKGQYAKIWIETDPEDPTNVHLLGDTKA